MSSDNLLRAEETAEQFMMPYMPNAIFDETRYKERIKYVTNKIIDSAKIGVDNSSRLVEMANNNKWAWEAVTEVSGARLEKGEILPESLTIFIGKLLQGAIEKPGVGRGTKYWERDWLLANTVTFIVEKHQLDPTRNKVSAERSACDVVSKVAMRHGINASYEVVKKVYSDWWGCEKK